MLSRAMSSRIQRLHRAGCGLLVLAGLSIAASAGAHAAPDPPALVLRVGDVLERDLAAGDVHVLALDVPASGRFCVRAHHAGMDLRLRLVGGDRVLEVDAPFERFGSEWLLLPAQAASWQLEVRSNSQAALAGRYTLALEALAETDGSTPGHVAMAEAGQLAARGQLPEALAAYDRALVVWRRLNARREQALALDARAALSMRLGKRSDARVAYGRSARLWAALGAAAHEASALNDRPWEPSVPGQLVAARRALGRALDLRRALGDFYGLAESFNNLGLLERHAERLEAAFAAFTQALAAAQQADSAYLVAQASNSLAGVQQSRGEYAAARDGYELALATFRRLGERRPQVRALCNLALLALNRGAPEAALERYEQALDLARASADAAPRDEEGEALALNGLGAARRALGDLDEARAAYDEALALRRRLGRRTGNTLNELAALELQSGNVVAALARAREAVIWQRHEGAEGGLLNARLRLGRALLLSGALQESQREFARALWAARRLASVSLEAEALHWRGVAAARAGRLAAARVDLLRALERRRQLELQDGQAETLTALAELERDQGRLTAALTHVRQAVDMIEGLRARVTQPERRARFLATERRRPYELRVSLLMALHERAPHAGHDRAALEAAEAARARTLVDLLDVRGFDPAQRIDPDLAARRAGLLDDITGLDSLRRDLLGAAGPRRATRARIESGLRTWREELAAVEASLRQHDPAYADLARPRALDLPAIQGLLDDDTLLLEYALGEPRSFLWAISRTGFSGYALPGRTRLEALTRAALEDLRQREEPPDADEPRRLARLGELLLGPAAALLTKPRLVIVPDGALHYLPFAALPRPAGAAVPAGVRGDDTCAGPEATSPWLVCSHELVSLPSVAALAAFRGQAARRHATHAFAVLADPVFESSDPRVRVSPERATPSGVRSPSESLLSGRSGRLPRLPHSLAEAQGLAALFDRRDAGQAASALVLTGFEADRSALVGGQLDGYQVLHFATHGRRDVQHPEQSALILTRVGPDGQPREGRLRLADVYRLRLNAELVVLAGCETAWGAEVPGEGLVGLVRGFMYAGVPRVVSSLWPVWDSTASDFMLRFYGRFVADREPRPPSAALRLAQLELLRMPQTRDPYFWASFGLQGDWQALPRPGTRASQATW